ncbi:oxidoreductase [Schleiferia thermophila str. Yellowstone]|uniref:Gfo/Idh/MocA family protein n=1 Tax=Schleiferia thermophila TaxID=884107 RepID=UPI0004E68323|nr:Gfo/Idh/MocA family oxidoreductase [Schleiferia thermophila]KFD40140.1 oxidoreductase [Schleiferia thermophila str. Yellowstone]
MKTGKKFGLIGAAGYVAPRHMKAIKDTLNELIVAYDPCDVVGILDSYFPDAAFFTEFERFDRHVELIKRRSQPIDFLSVCSPNYLHDSHIRFGLRIGADVICEKPLVLNPWNVEALMEAEREYGRRIYTVLQLRVHPSVMALKEMVDNHKSDQLYDVDLTYITSRGKWYYASWKGDESKSGGIVTNIGIHFFDMLIWIFGNPIRQTVHIYAHDRAAGFLELEKARVRWFLSINSECLPEHVRNVGIRTYRSLNINGEEFEFSDGFADLHTQVYREILKGNGYGPKDAYWGIEMAYQIRRSKPIGPKGEHHPLASLPLSPHPFLRNAPIKNQNLL